MDHAESISEIKRAATKIKKMLDSPQGESRHATVAIANANTQLNRIQRELALLERTLTQFIVAPVVVKMGPSETKSK